MTREEFMRVINVLDKAYDKPFDQAKTETWYGFFRTNSYEIFRAAVTRLIEKSKFLPSIAEIRAEIGFLNNLNMRLDADQEWESVLRAINRFGSYRADEGMASLTAMTQRAVQMMGGFRYLCTSENGDWDRQHFIEIFNRLKEREKQSEQITGALLTDTERETSAKMKQVVAIAMNGMDEGKTEQASGSFLTDEPMDWSKILGI